MIGRQLMSDPHGEPVAYLRQRILPAGQRRDLFVVNQQPVGVLNLKVVRVSRFKLDDAAFCRVGHHDLQRFPEKTLFILEFLRHLAIILLLQPRLCELR